MASCLSIAIAGGMLALPPLQSTANARQEAVFDTIWSQPIPPVSQRNKVNGWKLPVISELHRHVSRSPATSADKQREEFILKIFRSEGVLNIPTSYLRLTCRPGVCEYVIIHYGKRTESAMIAATKALTKAPQTACQPTTCQSAAVVTGGSGIQMALADYFIANDSGFI